MLFEDFKVDCVMLNKTKIPDGEGGWTTVWSDGATFKAAVVLNTSTQARIAEREGVSAIYTVTTDKNLGLEFHDVFKRLEDGKIFRVTSDSDDSKTPKMATFSFAQVTAEEWEI